MLQWNHNCRNILLTDSTLEKEKLCQQMIKNGYEFLVRDKNHAIPRGWSFATIYAEEVENYIMECAIPGTYDSTMVKVAASHAAFIADYGWDKYVNNLNKPQEVSDVNQFFYDSTFEDYDAKTIEIADPFKKEEAFDDDDDYEDDDDDYYDDYYDDEEEIEDDEPETIGEEIENELKRLQDSKSDLENL